MRTFALAVLILLAGGAIGATEAPELQQVRDQLKKAQEAEDKPAIIELSQRIVAIAPNDSNTWDTLAQTQLESEDLDGLEHTLDAWQKALSDHPERLKISAHDCASSVRIISAQSSTGLRLSQPRMERARRELR